MVLSAVALFWYLIATWILQTFLLYTSWSEGTIMIYIFSELHWNSDTRSIFNHSFYKDLQIEGIFDVLSRLAINQGVGSPVTLTSLWFINSWQNITLIRQPSKSKHSHCLCYQRNLHWDVARRCGDEKRGKMPFYETGLPSQFCSNEGAWEPARPVCAGRGGQVGRDGQSLCVKGGTWLWQDVTINMQLCIHPPSLDLSASPFLPICTSSFQLGLKCSNLFSHGLLCGMTETRWLLNQTRFIGTRSN